MKITRKMCEEHRALHRAVDDFSKSPIQLGLSHDPWKVMIASILLCRTRKVQMAPVVQELFECYPYPAALGAADSNDVEIVVRSCGLYRNRARSIIRASQRWALGAWEDLKDLPGVGAYVNDAVGLVCFGCTTLESSDGALHAYARRVEDARSKAAEQVLQHMPEAPPR